jgi:hypothetical protein
VSDQVTIGDYSLEISGDEVLVRDGTGAIVEELKLDDVEGELTLPDGKKVDLASILADGSVDTLQTAAGAANDNLGYITGGPAIFQILHPAGSELGGFHSVGTLDDTSLAYGLSETSTPKEPDINAPQARSSFDWSRHGPSGSDQPDSSGNLGGNQGQPGGSHADHSGDGGSVPPSGDLPPIGSGETSPAGNSVIQTEGPFTPPQSEQQPAYDDQGRDEIMQPTDEQQPPANDDQGADETSPPSDEQQQPANDDQGSTETTPPGYEQQQPAQDDQDGDETSPLRDEQQQPANDDQGRDEIMQPTDEQQPPANDDQPPANDDQGADETSPPTNEQQPPVNDDENGDGAPTSEQQQPLANDDQNGDETTSLTDEQQLPANHHESGDGATPPSDEQQPPANDGRGSDETMPPVDEQPLAANAAPTDIDLDNANVVENVAGAVIGALSVVDPDADDTHSFVVSDDRFEVVNGQLKLKDGISLDFEQTPGLDITVTATDKAGNQVAEIFSISVGDANEAQTALSLGNASVLENAAGAVVGTIAVADPDAGDMQSFSLSDDRFEVVSSQLKLKSGVSLDHETEPSVNLNVTSTDGAGHSIQHAFTISVANVNEAPVAAAVGGTFHSPSLQPTVDFSDVDSNKLSQAVIQTTGFHAGDALNVPASSLFNVTINHSTADYTITIVGKTGNETVDQYENFANSISFSTSSNTAGARHIDYTVTDSGGASSNVSTADVTVNSHSELYTSQMGKGLTTLGAGDDIVHIDTKSFSPVDMGAGEDTVHLAQQNRSFGHQDAVKLSGVETIDATGSGANNVSLSISDILSMTDSDNHLTIVGDKGDTVTLTGNGNNHWTVADSNAEFTTYIYNDPSHQAVVEVSNQLNTQVS